MKKLCIHNGQSGMADSESGGALLSLLFLLPCP